MNLPNKLTSARLGLTLLFVGLLASPMPHKFSAGLIIFCVASFTDFLDGYYARKFDLITTFGKLMDPLADKILMCAAFIVLCEQSMIPGWIVVVIVAREFLVTGIRLVATSQGAVLAADNLGKLKTVFQIATVIYFLLLLASEETYFSAFAPLFTTSPLTPALLGQGLIWLSLLATLVSGLNYLLNNRELLADC